MKRRQVLFLCLLSAVPLLGTMGAKAPVQPPIGSARGTGLVGGDSLFSEDAIILTLRLQESIFLDTTLAEEIERTLEAARSRYDTLRTVHALHDYVPTQLLLKSEAPWTQAWREGHIMTGNSAIDSLAIIYEMTSVEGPFLSSWFTLNYRHPLKIPLLVQEYKKVPGVIHAKPNGIVGDGDRIEAFKKKGIWHLAFSHGWGDCPAGCIYRYYWYVTVDSNLTAQLIEERERDPGVPWIYLWNIPPHYAATVFSNVEELFMATQSSQWWVRRHAVEVIGRLFVHDSPWVGEDDFANRSTFDALRDSVRSRRQEVVVLLRTLLNDSDPDVRTAVQIALNRVLGLAWGLYFPLKKGNHWTFLIHAPTGETETTETIIDTLRIDGKRYFRFDQFYSQKDVLLRMTEEAKLLIRQPGSTTEQIWLDFSLDVGESKSIYDPATGHRLYTITLESKTDSIGTSAGWFSNCYRFRIYFNSENYSIEWYAPAIGPIRRIWFTLESVDYELINAEVNGIVYPTSVTNPFMPELPRHFILYQNSPNPFNPVTTIRWEQPVKAVVKLTVYNTLGQEVKILLHKQMGVGVHQVSLSTQELASGVYLYQLQIGDFVETKKMVVLK